MLTLRKSSPLLPPLFSFLRTLATTSNQSKPKPKPKPKPDPQKPKPQKGHGFLVIARGPEKGQPITKEELANRRVKGNGEELKLKWRKIRLEKRSKISTLEPIDPEPEFSLSKATELAALYGIPDPHELGVAKSLFLRPASYIGSATQLEGLSRINVQKKPEIAFLGRSNVGKSTLLNALMGTDKLVKTSKSPGHTNMLNFFQVGENFVLVDMPGYGYGSEKKWLKNVEDYLRNRKNLQRVCLIIDSRHGINKMDRSRMRTFDKLGTPYQIILSKIDKTTQEEVAKVTKEVEEYIAKETASCFPKAIAVSGRKALMLDALRHSLVEKMGLFRRKKEHPSAGMEEVAAAEKEAEMKKQAEVKKKAEVNRFSEVRGRAR